MPFASAFTEGPSGPRETSRCSNWWIYDRAVDQVCCIAAITVMCTFLTRNELLLGTSYRHADM